MKSYTNYYFIGAGGIGMAALERYFNSKGAHVAGYDRTPSALTKALADEGIDIVFEDNAELIPESFTPETTLVVYTPAVPADNNIMTFFRDGGYTLFKRSQVLGMITSDSLSLCFSGTHGKTTTSSMAALILDMSSAGCNAFLGGVLRNTGSNLILCPDSQFSVVEADEFDRSFHYLSPYIAVVTATDPDHLDIYGTEEAYLESFAHFTELVRPDGALILHEGLKLVPRPHPGVKVFTYSRDKGNFHAINIRHDDGKIMFDLVTPTHIISDINLGVPVEINIENAIAAAAACYLTGRVGDNDIRNALDAFMGPKRRFEYWLRPSENPRHRAIIDDYAHHPDELRASISSVKALFPDRELTVAFQPHLYSRTRDFATEFADALSLADRVILLDIYPAREEPIPGVTSKIIFDKIKCQNKVMISKEKLTETIKFTNFDVLLTAGAGDICNFLPEIVEVAVQ